VSQCVLDNAVTMAWCFSDEATPFKENLLDRLSNLVDNFDAAYLELVIRRKLPLASLDTALIEACKALGARLI
jgi:hypothetical protein